MCNFVLLGDRSNHGIESNIFCAFRMQTDIKLLGSLLRLLASHFRGWVSLDRSVALLDSTGASDCFRAKIRPIVFLGGAVDDTLVDSTGEG